MVERHDVVHRVTHSIFIIVRTGKIRHQQSWSTPMMQTHDRATQLLGACGQPDGAGNVQTLSDLVEEVIADLAPVTVLVVLDLRHHTPQ
jgi:hypothetical protein